MSPSAREIPSGTSFRTIGLASSLLVVVLSLVIIGPMGIATFNGWVSFYALCCIPAQQAVVTYLEARAARPGAAGPGAADPARGAVLLGITLAIGAVAAVVVHYVVAAGWGTNFPGLPMFCIVAVVMGLWLTQVCQGRPFARIDNPVLRAAALLAAVYVLAYLAYRICFDYTAFGLPHGAGLRPAPSGLFPAWQALTFAVTAISGLFLAPAFRFARLPRNPGARAAVNTALCLAWGGLLFGLGVGVLGMDTVNFLVWVPVPILFGGLIVIKMCRGSFYPARPTSVVANGTASLVTAVAVGVALVWVYRLVLALTHPGVAWHPPTYAGEVWVAGATLAVTFPLLNVAADFFGFRPFAPGPHPARVTVAEPEGAI